MPPNSSSKSTSMATPDWAKEMIMKLQSSPATPDGSSPPAAELCAQRNTQNSAYLPNKYKKTPVSVVSLLLNK